MTKRNLLFSPPSYVCLVGFLKSLPATRIYRGRVLRLTCHNFTCCHTETERGDHDFCRSRSHHTDTVRSWDTKTVLVSHLRCEEILRPGVLQVNHIPSDLRVAPPDKGPPGGIVHRAGHPHRPAVIRQALGRYLGSLVRRSRRG